MNYTIKQGDTLSKIAAANGTTVQALAAANNIANVNKIYSGQTLSIPGASTGTQAPQPAAAPAPSTTATQSQLAALEAAKPGAYSASADVTAAADMLKQKETAKPGAYSSAYQSQIDALLNKITNREDFSYDMNADPLYNQYKEQYQAAGKLAMQDTMANAAGLTGGYGSSYATTAGQQAYQGSLDNLNNVIPELASAAYGKYQDKGNDMYNQMGLYQGLEATDYGKYQDTVSNYYDDLNYYYNKYGDMSTADYNKYQNNMDQWQADRAYYYGKQQDEQEQANYEAEIAYQKAQDAAAAAAAAAKAASSGSSSRSGSSGSSGKSSGSSGKSSGGTTSRNTQQFTQATAAAQLKEIVNTKGIAAARIEQQRMAQSGLYINADKVDLTKLQTIGTPSTGKTTAANTLRTMLGL